MKNKYQRMDKNNKKELYKKYVNTPLGRENMNRLYRILIFGIAAILYSVYQIINYTNYFKVSSIVLSIIFIIFGLLYVISFFRLRGKYLNKFALKQK